MPRITVTRRKTGRINISLTADDFAGLYSLLKTGEGIISLCTRPEWSVVASMRPDPQLSAARTRVMGTIDRWIAEIKTEQPCPTMPDYDAARRKLSTLPKP